MADPNVNMESFLSRFSAEQIDEAVALVLLKYIKNINPGTVTFDDTLPEAQIDCEIATDPSDERDRLLNLSFPNYWRSQNDLLRNTIQLLNTEIEGLNSELQILEDVLDELYSVGLPEG